MTRLLLDDRLAPSTAEIGFLETDVTTAVDGYLRWQRGLRGATRGLDAHPVEGRLEDALRALLPLRDTIRSRELFVPTAGPWTAYFDNGWTGPDPVTPMSYLARTLGCRGLRVVAVPNTVDEQRRTGRYGASILESYGPRDTDFLNYERSIVAANDGGRWVFEEFGEPFPFERRDRYGARRVRDRFPFELLDEYLGQLGVRAFDETFYAPERLSVLVRRRLARGAPGREHTLEEARAGF